MIAPHGYVYYMALRRYEGKKKKKKKTLLSKL